MCLKKQKMKNVCVWFCKHISLYMSLLSLTHSLDCAHLDSFPDLSLYIHVLWWILMRNWILTRVSYFKSIFKRIEIIHKHANVCKLNVEEKFCVCVCVVVGTNEISTLCSVYYEQTWTEHRSSQHTQQEQTAIKSTRFMPVCCCDFVYITRDYVLNTCHVSQVTEYTVIGLVIFTLGSFIFLPLSLSLSLEHFARSFLSLSLCRCLDLTLSSFAYACDFYSTCIYIIYINVPIDGDSPAVPNVLMNFWLLQGVVIDQCFVDCLFYWNSTCVDFDKSGNYLELAFSSFSFFLWCCTFNAFSFFLFCQLFSSPFSHSSVLLFFRCLLLSLMLLLLLLLFNVIFRCAEGKMKRSKKKKQKNSPWRFLRKLSIIFPIRMQCEERVREQRGSR